MQTNKHPLEQNLEVLARAAHDSTDPVLLNYVNERMRALKTGFMDFERLEVGGGCDDGWASSGANAGHGRNVRQVGSSACAIKPPRCDCHVIGGNTLGTAGIGTATLAGRFGQVSIDSGDASYFVPYYIFIAGFQVGGVAPNTTVQGAALPLLLQDSRSGQAPNMRRASTTNPSFGVITAVYGDQKELECVDWLRFASINNQNLTVDLYNLNAVTVHGFVDLWGIPAVGG